ncbi:MAG: ribosome assembly cofactor RimP [Cryomorphaceae bacterium]|nr:ribosome assembly cofactor RimP [Cryomorphaceae bacterium]
MIDKQKVAALCEEALSAFDGFLVELTVDEHNNIQVLADTDAGITIEQLKQVSRNVEGNLDRETADFMLTVSSPGLSRPLDSYRMYRKNDGREVKVKTKTGEKLTGILEVIDEQTIELRWTTREPKPIGKGKVTVEKNQRLALDEIQETKLKISI